MVLTPSSAKIENMAISEETCNDFSDLIKPCRQINPWRKCFQSLKGRNSAQI